MRTQAELKSLGLLIHSVRYMLGAELGLYNMGEMVSRKVMCVHAYIHACVFSAWQVLFLPVWPTVLILAIEVALTVELCCGSSVKLLWKREGCP